MGANSTLFPKDIKSQSHDFLPGVWKEASPPPPTTARNTSILQEVLYDTWKGACCKSISGEVQDL